MALGDILGWKALPGVVSVYCYPVVRVVVLPRLGDDVYAAGARKETAVMLGICSTMQKFDVTSV